MAGELWRSFAQMGKQTTETLAVAATRRFYGRTLTLSGNRASQPIRMQNGRRGNVVGHTQGPIEAAGAFQMEINANEIIEPLLMGVKGGVTPSTVGTNGKRWVFTPSETVDFATFEKDNAAEKSRGVGLRLGDWSLAGNAGPGGENLFSANLFGVDYHRRLPALTAGLAERTILPLSGWQTRWYLTDFGSDPAAATLTSGALIDWSVQSNNNFGRAFRAENVQRASRTTVGQLDLTATMKLDPVAAVVVSEMQKWEQDVKRMMRLEFLGPRGEIDPGTNEAQTVTITGTPTGGTFTLTFNTQTTAPIAHNATAAAVQAALEMLGTIGPGNVAVSGGPGPGTPYVVTFQGLLGYLNVAQMTAAHTFTGGTTPNVAVTTTTPGAEGVGYAIWLDIPGAWTAPDENQEDAGAIAYSSPFQYVYEPVQGFEYRWTVTNNRAAAWT